MAFIPPDAEWYVADLVEEIHVTGRKRQTVYINTVLIRADSPEEAYKKAFKMGKEGKTNYKNLNGETFHCRFRGISELNVIHDELGDGCEISYRSKPSMTENGIKKLVSSKSNLAVFRAIKPKNMKNHFPASIAIALNKRLKGPNQSVKPINKERMADL